MSETENKEEIMHCTNCGSPLAEGSAFCTNCGQPVVAAAAATAAAAANSETPWKTPAPSYQQEFYNQKQEKQAESGQQQPSYQPAEPRVFPQPATKRALAMCLYAGLLPLIFGFAVRDKDDEFITFHLNQALVVTLGAIISALLSAVFIGVLLGIFIFVMAIMGMISAYNGDQKELPLIGKIKLVK